MAELLVHGNHMDMLIQELTRFVLGYRVLAHDEQDLDSHFSLLHVRWSRLGRKCEDQGKTCQRVRVVHCKDVALEKGLT